MNIFRLSNCPVEAAQMVCDSHSSKMCVESAQMLSTAHRILDGTPVNRMSKTGKRVVKYYKHPDEFLEERLYKSVHPKHPSTIWTMESSANYAWHYQHFIALCKEFRYRFGKTHMSEIKLAEILSQYPRNIPVAKETKFRLAMSQYPECIVENDPVQSYRNFYIADKIEFAKWNRGRKAPSWWIERASL